MDCVYAKSCALIFYGGLTVYCSMFTQVIVYSLHRIDMPVLNDQFDASLILMKRRYCWSYTDIFYTAFEKSKRKDTTLSDESIKRITSPEVNVGELWLYESLNNTWWRQKELTENRFWEEVSNVWCLSPQHMEPCPIHL